MNWKFWKKTADQNGAGKSKDSRAGKPRDLPEAVGRKMVVGMKLDPDMVWALKYVSRPLEGRNDAREFRIFDPNAVRSAGFVPRDWSSFDDHPDLVLYAGVFDKQAATVEFHGRE